MTKKFATNLLQTLINIKMKNQKKIFYAIILLKM
jgi:hypothetical protein